MRPFKDWKVVGRPIKPFSFALMLSLFGAAWYYILILDTVEHIPLLIGVIAIVAATFLFVGWWWRIHSVHLWGLVLSAGSWASMTTALTFDTREYISAWFAVCWFIAIVGAWLIERDEQEEIL